VGVVLISGATHETYEEVRRRLGDIFGARMEEGTGILEVTCVGFTDVELGQYLDVVPWPDDWTEAAIARQRLQLAERHQAVVAAFVDAHPTTMEEQLRANLLVLAAYVEELRADADATLQPHGAGR